MKEVIDDINRWQEEKQPVALATVVQTWGSAPRKVGAKMALTPDGRISGSVSGGCVEGCGGGGRHGRSANQPPQAAPLRRGRRNRLGRRSGLRRYD
jgi:hypothetical protein